MRIVCTVSRASAAAASSNMVLPLPASPHTVTARARPFLASLIASASIRSCGSRPISSIRSTTWTLARPDHPLVVAHLCRRSRHFPVATTGTSRTVADDDEQMTHQPGLSVRAAIVLTAMFCGPALMIGPLAMPAADTGLSGPGAPFIVAMTLIAAAGALAIRYSRRRAGTEPDAL